MMDITFIDYGINTASSKSQKPSRDFRITDKLPEKRFS